MEKVIYNVLKKLKDSNYESYIVGGYVRDKLLGKKGFDIDIIYGARNKDMLLVKDKIEEISNVIYATDDGSYGSMGFVTDILQTSISKYDVCVAIGPVIMMKNVCELTKKYNLKTIVSMNPIMIDGSGMCGACRCIVNGKTKFACIDGPEFDGHKVDFDISLNRMNIYKSEQQEKLKEMKERLGE